MILLTQKVEVVLENVSLLYQALGTSRYMYTRRFELSRDECCFRYKLLQNNIECNAQ